MQFDHAPQGRFQRLGPLQPEGLQHAPFVLAAEPQLANSAEGYAPRPAYRPLTKFEQRGVALGHGVWDLVFRKRG